MPAVATSADVSADAAASPRAVVSFGDSVPSGAACHCTNFVSVYARQLPGKATVANYAEGGSTSADALARLDESKVTAQVRKATTVLIMTGANDFVDSFVDVTDGADPDDSFGPVAKQVRTNVMAEVKQIHKLNPAAHIVVLDYWAAMEDGAVAQRNYDAAERRAAAQATDYLNDALAAAAKATDATFISTMRAFKGADGKTDPTPLLESDGDHPNAAGHKAIADAISAVLPRG
jgi:lysophospholipase L1-like esterase